jgi:UDP-N-acetylglucosamine--N-acetylmuramyl-(pentapeptide) pyrophosphoryl-undecaprenol N-acetylglucosamine transferase
MKKHSKTIAYVAGLSGGHIIPCLTLAQQERAGGSAILFFTRHAPLDLKIIAQAPEIERLYAFSFPASRHTFFAKVRFIYSFIYAFVSSFFILLRSRASKVVSSGGYIALPVCFAAWLLRIEIELYELNGVPGKATTLLAHLAKRVFVCFRQTISAFKHAELVAYPVRFQETDTIDRETALKKLGLSLDKKTVLILGGSQGSKTLNSSICQWLREYSFLHNQLQIIHQAGTHDVAFLQQEYANGGFQALVADYFSQLALLYSAADVVIARAGAGTLFETLFFKKPAIIIPLEGVADDHQVANASLMAQEHPQLFCVIRQKELSAAALAAAYSSL